MKYRYSVQTGTTRIKTNTKKYVTGIIAVLVMAGGMTLPAMAAAGSNASSCGAAHGAFNYQNSVYGSTSGPGNGSKGDSSGFGTGGGAPGSNDGAVGQDSGATGYNNSHTNCQ